MLTIVLNTTLTLLDAIIKTAMAMNAALAAMDMVEAVRYARRIGVEPSRHVIEEMPITPMELKLIFGKDPNSNDKLVFKFALFNEECHHLFNNAVSAIAGRTDLNIDIANFAYVISSGKCNNNNQGRSTVRNGVANSICIKLFRMPKAEQHAIAENLRAKIPQAKEELRRIRAQVEEVEEAQQIQTQQIQTPHSQPNSNANDDNVSTNNFLVEQLNAIHINSNSASTIATNT